MQIELIRERRAFDQLATDWNRLLAEDCAAPLGMDVTSSFEWASALLDSFLLEQEWYVAVARKNAEIVGILPVCHRASVANSFFTPRVLSPITSLYGGRNGFLIHDGNSEILQKLIEHLLQNISGWDLFSFHIVNGSRSEQMLTRLSGRISSWIRKQHSKISPILMMPEDIEAWSTTIKPSLRKNLRRRKQQLEQLGSLRFELFQDPDDIPRYHKAMLYIEQNSWKHAAGTSITRKPEQAKFYQALLPHAARSGQWLSGLLTINDEPVAHSLSIVHQGVALGLKASYVEKMKKNSPSSVLRWLYLQDVHNLGIRYFDFSGDAESHKMQWTSQTYTLTGMRLFRSTARGRMAMMRNQLGQLKAKLNHSPEKK